LCQLQHEDNTKVLHQEDDLKDHARFSGRIQSR
jgi:hypothetical protein